MECARMPPYAGLESFTVKTESMYRLRSSTKSRTGSRVPFVGFVRKAAYAVTVCARFFTYSNSVRTNSIRFFCLSVLTRRSAVLSFHSIRSSTFGENTYAICAMASVSYASR